MGDLQIVVPAVACKNVEAQYVEMMVPLYSYGCEKKVKKTLSHLKGIYSVNVNYQQQKVTVWGICNKYDVLATVRSKRKEARFWNPEDNIVVDEQSQSQPTPSPPSDPRPPNKHNAERDYYSFSYSKPSLALTKVRSLSLKAWKRLVFTRSYSF